MCWVPAGSDFPQVILRLPVQCAAQYGALAVDDAADHYYRRYPSAARPSRTTSLSDLNLSKSRAKPGGLEAKHTKQRNLKQ
jgi:hypothetical protein